MSKSRKQARRKAARRPGRGRQAGTPQLPAPPGAPARQARVPAAADPATVASVSRPPVSGEASGESPGWAENLLQQILTATCWLDPGEHGGPYPVTVVFSGRRAGVTGQPKPGDTFTWEETFDGIVPGSGPVAVTATIRGINPGEWTVTARPVARAGSRRPGRYAPARDEEMRGGRGELWPRQLTIPAGQRAQASTALLPLAKTPGIARFAWAGLVFLGVLAGLGIQAALLARARLPAGPALAVSAAAVGAGVTGAKLWYIAVHRGRRLDGWCIQGFIAGAGAAVAAAVPFAALGVPAGTYLNAAVPGLLLGMAIGRPGCFWAGCCTGRPTQSRWGIWSSDRRVGARRIPAQLLEALLCPAIGLTALLTVLVTGPEGPGTLAAAAVAAYTLGRQFILGTRADPPRRSRLSGPVTTIGAAAVLTAAIFVAAVA